MISMGTFVALGGMDTLRDHAIAVDIGDVSIDETDHHTFFVDLRFRFISEQARTFFLKQSVSHETDQIVHGVCPKSLYPVPGNLVSLISDDPHSVNDGVVFRRQSGNRENSEVLVSSGKDTTRCMKKHLKSVDRNQGTVGNGESLVREKLMFLPDTSWIDRTEPLSTISPPSTNQTPDMNDANRVGSIDKPRHITRPTYLSDSTSNTSDHTLSDDEFPFIGPRQKRMSSLMETQDSVELTRNYWNKNRFVR